MARVEYHRLFYGKSRSSRKRYFHRTYGMKSLGTSVKIGTDISFFFFFYLSIQKKNYDMFNHSRKKNWMFLYSTICNDVKMHPGYTTIETFERGNCQ